MLRKYSGRLFVRAFTLIELLVSAAIMTMILGITLSGTPQTLVRLSLADATYAAELLIREAQLQGTAINSINDTYGGAGVYFDLNTPTKVIKFRDKVDPNIVHTIGIGNGLYDQGVADEFNIEQTITGKHKISKLCVKTGTDPFVCNSDNDPPITNLTVSFIRPSQNTYIYINNSTTTNFSAGCIQFDSIKAPAPGYVRSIMVYRSGMITKRLTGCENL